jgi:hypothetical protein
MSYKIKVLTNSLNFLEKGIVDANYSYFIQVLKISCFLGQYAPTQKFKCFDIILLVQI